MKDEDFQRRRQQGRELAGSLQADSEQRGEPLGWFEGLYEAADGDVAVVPWAGTPHFTLVDWLEKNPGQIDGKVIDVGCGLGDNAVALERAGGHVTAFDLSQTAVDWAAQRHRESNIGFRQADLFSLPAEWIGAFDFVNETYTVQALKGTMRIAACAEIASLLKPGGKLLVICRSRADDAPVVGPPWPLSRRELKAFEKAGLSIESFEEVDNGTQDAIPHFRIVYSA